ncbi:hypothetical protein BLA50215_01497 [Burkholderia lata]|nr:hypothetical protein BLA50215_01497 [Burkholderia lata]
MRCSRTLRRTRPPVCTDLHYRLFSSYVHRNSTDRPMTIDLCRRHSLVTIDRQLLPPVCGHPALLEQTFSAARSPVPLLHHLRTRDRCAPRMRVVPTAAWLQSNLQRPMTQQYLRHTRQASAWKTTPSPTLANLEICFQSYLTFHVSVQRPNTSSSLPRFLDRSPQALLAVRLGESSSELRAQRRVHGFLQTRECRPLCMQQRDRAESVAVHHQPGQPHHVNTDQGSQVTTDTFTKPCSYDY